MSNRHIVADRDDGMPALCIAETRTHRLCLPGECFANAALIVRAVNAHAGLVAVLRDARECIAEDAEAMLSCCTVPGPDGWPDRTTLDDIDRPHIERMEATLARIEVTLARAEQP